MVKDIVRLTHEERTQLTELISTGAGRLPSSHGLRYCAKPMRTRGAGLERWGDC